MGTGISSMAQMNGINAALGAMPGAGSGMPIYGGSNALSHPVTQSQVEAYNQKKAAHRNAMLSGSLGTAAALGHIASGFAERAALRTDAYNYDYQAKAARLEGQRQALLEMDAFAQSQARSIAAIGASGIGYEGSPMSGLAQAEGKHQSNLGLIKANAEVEYAGYRGMAKQARRNARLAPLSGFLRAGAQVGSMFAGGLGGGA